MKRRNKIVFTLTLIVPLYSCLTFATAQWTGCRVSSPDDWCDLFGMPSNSADSSRIFEPGQSVFPFSDFTPQFHIFECYPSVEYYPEPFSSELLLSVAIRCSSSNAYLQGSIMSSQQGGDGRVFLAKKNLDRFLTSFIALFKEGERGCRTLY